MGTKFMIFIGFITVSNALLYLQNCHYNVSQFKSCCLRKKIIQHHNHFYVLVNDLELTGMKKMQRQFKSILAVYQKSSNVITVLFLPQPDSLYSTEASFFMTRKFLHSSSKRTLPTVKYLLKPFSMPILFAR